MSERAILDKNGCIAYLVTDDGRVLSGHGRRSYFRELKPERLHNGYLRVCVCIDGNAVRWRVHRLVARAFHGELPPNLDVHHVNGVRTDNRLGNLEMVTRAENIAAKGPTASAYIGAYRDKGHHRWQAQISVNGKKLYLGRFDTEEEAALAYDAVVIRDGLAGRLLNFPGAIRQTAVTP